MDRTSEARRDFVRKAAYVAPAILTLQSAPSYAKFGSEKPDKGNKGGKKGSDQGESAMNGLSSTPDALPPPRIPSA
jgi:hypothetical protein